MPEDKQNPQDSVPQYFEEFRTQVGETVKQLAQSQQQIAEAVQLQAQNIQKSQQATPQPAAQPLASKEQNDRFLNEFVANPTETFTNFRTIVTEEARREAGEMIAQREQARQQEEAARQFEQEFFAHNRDLAPYRALVVEHLQKQPANLDPSARANAAAEEVRQLLVQSQAQAVENDRRQRAEKLRAAGIRGVPHAPQGAEHLNVESEAEGRLKRTEVMDNYIAQRMAQ